MEIGKNFFERDPVTCARELVGCVFRWKGCEGIVVETEAYAATGDEACHTWSRPGARKFVEEHDAGDAYVYLNYGVHWLFNVLVKGEDSGFVLLRALEPVAGLPVMRKRRGNVPDRMLCAGPGRLARALAIDGSDHGVRFLNRIESGFFLGKPRKLREGPRIGISKAVEKSWRFGDAASASVSRKF